MTGLSLRSSEDIRIKTIGDIIEYEEKLSKIRPHEYGKRFDELYELSIRKLIIIRTMRESEVKQKK